MEKIQLIACDLDGTLLQNGAQEIDPIIFTQIKRLQQKGILFMAASGREYTNLRRLFEPVKDDIAYLCLNGCLTVYHNQCVSKENMDTTVAKKLIQILTKDTEAEVLVSGEKTSYICSKDINYLIHIRDVVKNNVTLVKNLLCLPESYSKISGYFKDGVGCHFDSYKKLFSDEITVQIGGKQWLDFMPKGIHKGAGFVQLLKSLHIDIRNTVMFGDNDNDRQILQASQYGIAMANAKQEIRDLCAYQVVRVTDGLQAILEGRSLQTLKK